MTFVFKKATHQQKGVFMFLVPYSNKKGNPFGLSNSLFDSFFEDWSSLKPSSDTSPKVNVSEDEKAYYFAVQLPGYNEKDVDVSFTEGVLTIKGETESEKEDKELKHKEFSYGSFARSFRLPEEILEQKIEAQFGKGILSITLPKKEEAQPKIHKINVKPE